MSTVLVYIFITKLLKIDALSSSSFKKLKLPVFGRAAFNYSVVQPPFDIFVTSTGHWATLGN